MFLLNDKVSTETRNKWKNNIKFSKRLCLIALSVYSRKLWKKGTWERLWLIWNAECVRFTINWKKYNYYTKPLLLETLLFIVNILKSIESFPVIEIITIFHWWLQMCCLFLVILSKSNLHSLHFHVPWEIWFSWTASVSPFTSSLLLHFWPKSYICSNKGKSQRKRWGIFATLSPSWVNKG